MKFMDSTSQIAQHILHGIHGIFGGEGLAPFGGLVFIVGQQGRIIQETFDPLI
jgi:hypothetical protein